MTPKTKKRIAATQKSSVAKWKRENARTRRKKELEQRDREPTEQELNKHDEINGTTIVKKEEFHFGIFYVRGYQPVFDYSHNRSHLYRTREQAEKVLETLKAQGVCRIEVREILW